MKTIHTFITRCDMEFVSILLAGELEHRDNIKILRSGNDSLNANN